MSYPQIKFQFLHMSLHSTTVTMYHLIVRIQTMVDINSDNEFNVYCYYLMFRWITKWYIIVVMWHLWSP